MMLNIFKVDSENTKTTLTLFRMALFGTAHGWEGAIDTYPTMMKLGIVVPYLQKI